MTTKLPAPIIQQVASASSRVPTSYLGQKRQQRHLTATEAHILGHNAIARAMADGWLALRDVENAEREYGIAKYLNENRDTALATAVSKERADLKRALADERKADTLFMDADMEHDQKRQEYKGHKKEIAPERTPSEVEDEVRMATDVEWYILREEEKVNDYIRRNGGEDNLNDQQRRQVESLRQKYREMREL